jgi:hypothetical protein
MADQKSPKPKAVDREARRLERLCKLRLVPEPPMRIVPVERFDYEPKDAA